MPGGSPARPLDGRTVLVTGITDEASLATQVARTIQEAGGRVVCAGLGPTPFHDSLSERARAHLESTFESLQKTVAAALGEDTPTVACDLSIDGSIAALADGLAAHGSTLEGVVHAVAFDRTLRPGREASLLRTSREEFLECMNVSAYSLIALLRALLDRGALGAGAGVVALSYLGAERVVSHPYKNVAAAKAALERIVSELAFELGFERGVRVNAVRFSPYSASRAGGAIPGLAEAEEAAARRSPLGNAAPLALGHEVVHLLRPDGMVTGEVRHVDGGQHLLAG